VNQRARGLSGKHEGGILQHMMKDSPKPDGMPSPDALVFRARLNPHRSLGPTGLVVLFAGLVGLTTAISIPFYIMGAMPVVGFLGLDIFLLWLAFRINNQRARAFEELVLTNIELLVRRVSWRGRTSEWRFNPLWVKVASDDHAEFGMQRLSLVEGKKQVELASFLGAEEKADFANALRAALAEARRGPRAA
jgi:uncharacterized membrane protein